MKVHNLWKARLGEWIFGSAVVWGCVAPLGGASDLLGGQPNSCSGTTTLACQGLSHCSSYFHCACIGGSSGNCEPVQIFCPSGCFSVQPTRCTSGSMNNCYY